MRTYLSAGIDIGTRGIRLTVIDCSSLNTIYKEVYDRHSIDFLLKTIKGLGVERICVAGGYQWREVTNHDIYSEELIAFGSSQEETHGLRRTVRMLSLAKELLLLPSGGASGELPRWFTFNVLDSGTPDKVAKANYIIHRMGLHTFTLIDDGCFTTLIGIEDDAITKVIASTWGVPGKCSPGRVDVELCLAFKWPQSKRDLIDCDVPNDVMEGWIDFYKELFPSPYMRGSELDEFSASEGAALWCCGLRPKHIFSSRPWGCLWDKHG
ncbi:hypothetical protein IPA_04175 [Ignicoccus pacificus DSM 13166]|uniref:Uncharacterized protein n=1 Tax=Ignicoccus pacificus DSM 13166 TaxID=940294 RepID=A0A977KB23_9CREN|nr:hypothetical protein IPA_04175 [Ignicoccus pacificus DSM 13166]